MTVNENIRRIRIEKGLTQKQVAEACGTVSATIRTYESGRANPKPATVAKIATALGVTPAELYGRREDGERDPYTEFAIYQAENTGEIDEGAVNLRRLLIAFDKLSFAGQEVAIQWAEGLAAIPTLKTCQTVADVLGGLNEKEQREILCAYHSVQSLTYELSIMDKQQQKMESQLPENPSMKKDYERHIESRKDQVRMINERKNDILEVILAALDRSGLFDSGK